MRRARTSYWYRTRHRVGASIGVSQLIETYRDARVSLTASCQAVAFVAGMAALASPAAAFDVDASIDEVRRAFGARTVAGIEVGARGYVSALFTTFCVADGRLKLPAATEATEPNASGPGVYALDRLDDTSVSLAPAGGATARLDLESLKTLTTQVSLAPACAVSHPGATLFDVSKLMGATSLIELTSRATGGATRTTIAAGAPAGEQAVDGWDVAVTESPGGGPPVVILSLRARDDKGATLALRCRGRETAMYVVTNTLLPLTEDYRIEIETARDNDDFRAEQATTSATNETFFLRNAVAKAVLLLGAKTYSVSYTDVSGDRHSPIFDLAGLDVHLPRLRLACGW